MAQTVKNLPAMQETRVRSPSPLRGSSSSNRVWKSTGISLISTIFLPAPTTGLAKSPPAFSKLA